MDSIGVGIVLELLEFGFWIIGLLLIIVVGVLGFVGNRIFEQLDTLSNTFALIEKDLRDDLSALDRRLTKVETIVGGRTRRKSDGRS